jgi:ABC-type polysaccharide/polyol phosphate transport system ATPase subunit
MTRRSAIVADGISKRYTKLEEKAVLLRSILPFARPKKTDFWALRDMSFSVAEGEMVGVLGRNGAGKTTLLRLLAGVTRPTEGHVTVQGPVAPLISVGVGFQREMSGRENVFLNGMLLGLTYEEVSERFDDIVAFAELHDFIDTPVKFYSSGMFMRLGFAVAIHIEPRTLLVDEVLAVGDGAFQVKCLHRMQQLRDGGTTVVLVSHALHVIRHLCPRAILIVAGRVEYDGDTPEALARYHRTLSAGPGSGVIDEHEHKMLGGATIVGSELFGTEGPSGYADPGTPLTLRVRVRFDRPVDSPAFGMFIYDADNTLVHGRTSDVYHRHRSYGPGEEAEVEVRFVCRLGGGSYRVTPVVATEDGRGTLAVDPDAVHFYVPPRPFAWGVADLESKIFVDGTDVTVVGLDTVREVDAAAGSPAAGEPQADGHVEASERHV